jgi:hypothetical protein
MHEQPASEQANEPPAPTQGLNPPGFPPLPAGYGVQAPWGFHDAAGRMYEFYRVYGPPHDAGARGDVSRIDEGASFWLVTWPNPEGNDRDVETRWINFADARKRLGRRLRFQNFASSLEMRDVLPRLLDVDVAAATKH